MSRKSRVLIKILIIGAKMLHREYYLNASRTNNIIMHDLHPFCKCILFKFPLYEIFTWNFSNLGTVCNNWKKVCVQYLDGWLLSQR